MLMAVSYRIGGTSIFTIYAGLPRELQPSPALTQFKPAEQSDLCMACHFQQCQVRWTAQLQHTDLAPPRGAVREQMESNEVTQERGTPIAHWGTRRGW